MGATRSICRDGQCETTFSAPDGGSAFVSDERRCLPAVVCDSWAGCTYAMGNAQDGWYVTDSDRVARGEPVTPDRVAVADGGAADVLRLHPAGATCLPQSIPPVLSPPGYTCRVEGLGCKKTPR